MVRSDNPYFQKFQQFTVFRSFNPKMEPIRRDLYLNRLIERRENGLIKVVTGIRRCGKSYLLFRLYYEYLLGTGVDASNILTVPLDDDDFEELRDRKALGAYIKQRVTDKGTWFIFLDEVQMCEGFESVLNGLNRHENLDIMLLEAIQSSFPPTF